jgi:hypothetical protein
MPSLRSPPDSTEKHDAFFSVAAGINISNPLGRNWSLIGGLSAYKRNNFSWDQFDTGYLDGYLGLAKKYERDTWDCSRAGQYVLRG